MFAVAGIVKGKFQSHVWFMRQGDSLRDIGMVCRDYWRDHNGRFPASVQEMKEWWLSSGARRLPDGASMWDDFYYVAGVNSSDSRLCIVAYQVPKFSWECTPVLLRDTRITSFSALGEECGISPDLLFAKPWMSAILDTPADQLDELASRLTVIPPDRSDASIYLLVRKWGESPKIKRQHRGSLLGDQGHPIKTGKE
jgi:hypothetical protein